MRSEPDRSSGSVRGHEAVNKKPGKFSPERQARAVSLFGRWMKLQGLRGAVLGRRVRTTTPDANAQRPPEKPRMAPGDTRLQSVTSLLK